MSKRKLRSKLGRSTSDKIYVRGYDLTQDLLGKVGLGDVAFLELMGRLPSAQESVVFNAVVVTLVEHGMTPSAIAARMTYFGAPESVQGAVAAGLLGMGNRFGGSIEQAARILQEAKTDGEPRTVAREIVAGYRARKQIIPGLGHPIHRSQDPRTARLFELAAQNGHSGRHVELMQAIGDEATQVYGRPLPVNATGAIAAVASELGIPWTVCRGLAVMARAIGLVAHVEEESAQPTAADIWAWVESETES